MIVKIFNELDAKELERKLDEYVKTYDDPWARLFDIKYTTTKVNNDIMYSALIILI
jgi:hypothetical protein